MLDAEWQHRLQAQVSTLEATVNTLCLEVMEVRRLLVADRVNLRACSHPATIEGPIADIAKKQLPFLATLSKSAFIGYMGCHLCPVVQDKLQGQETMICSSELTTVGSPQCVPLQEVSTKALAHRGNSKHAPLQEISSNTLTYKGISRKAS